MDRQQKPSPASERGAVLVHVAFAFIALLAFTTFVVDYGVFWLARRQAQNSADAGAMGAALYMAWDGTDQPGAQNMAVDIAQRNIVFGQVPDITTADVTFPACPPGAPGPPDTCVRVDVFRNQRPGGNPLPIFFGGLVGLTNQAIQATATAQILYPASSECVKPFAIPDKWVETDGVDSDGDGDFWDPTDTFDRYDNKGNLLPGVVDSYLPPTYDADGNVVTTGSGFTLENDYGLQLTLKSQNQQNIAPGWYYPVVIDPGCVGGNCYRDAIADCVTIPVNPPQQLTNEPGNMVGPTRQGVDDLIALDQGAYWDPGIGPDVDGDGSPDGGVAGGCMAAGTCAVSPRIAAIPVFDVEDYYLGKVSGRTDVKIVRILGFFFEPMGAKNGEVTGRFMTYPATLSPGSTYNNKGSFLRTVILVR
jgi:hypothetical protein